MFPVEGRLAREQFVEQHAQAVDVAARVDIDAAHLRLLGAGVSRRADERVETREQRFVGEPLARGLRDPKVDYFRHGGAIIDGDENV